MDNKRLFNLKVKKVFKVFNFHDKYFKECITKDIIDDLDDGINTDKFTILENNKLYCNVYGAKLLASKLNINFSVYEDTLIFLNSESRKTEKKRDLDIDINLNHNDDIYVNHKAVNDYISDICIGISLNGKSLDEIDKNKLSDKDIKTINGSIRKYNRIAKAGHYNQAHRLTSVYKYIEDNDPNICRRSLYNFDYDIIELEDFARRYDFYDYIEIRKAYKKNVKKFNKKFNKKNN